MTPDPAQSHAVVHCKVSGWWDTGSPCHTGSPRDVQASCAIMFTPLFVALQREHQPPLRYTLHHPSSWVCLGTPPTVDLPRDLRARGTPETSPGHYPGGAGTRPGVARSSWGGPPRQNMLEMTFTSLHHTGPQLHTPHLTCPHLTSPSGTPLRALSG